MYTFFFMSVQCHFLSTNTLQKKFFKLTTLVPIAAEMNLNIKRLQTLTASSVVDCTACQRSQLFGGRGEEGGAYGEEEGLHIYTLGIQGFVFAQFMRYSPILSGRKSLFLNWHCAENKPYIKLQVWYTLYHKTICFRAHSRAPKNKQTAKCTFKCSTLCEQGSISQIFHDFFPLSHVMLFEDIVWSSVHRKQHRSKRWATKM